MSYPKEMEQNEISESQTDWETLNISQKKKSTNDMIKNGQRDLIRPRLYGHSLQGRILGNFIKRVNKLKTENVR